MKSIIEGEWILAEESAQKDATLPPLPFLEGMPNPPPGFKYFTS